MRTAYDFERFNPPTLTEQMLRRELERRAQRRRTILLAIAGALFEALFVLLGFLLAQSFPALALSCFCFAIVSAAGSGVIAIVYAQKGEKGYVYSF